LWASLTFSLNIAELQYNIDNHSTHNINIEAKTLTSNNLNAKTIIK